MKGYITVLCAIVGALVYVLATATPPGRAAKFSELGRLTFFAAMIALMMAFGVHVANLF